MEPERWERVEAVFSAALEQEEALQEALVAEACGDDHALREEVVSLLRAHRDSSHTTFIDAPVARVREGSPPGDSAGEPSSSGLGFGAPASLGPYRLLHRLGSGGMGSVFLGLRADDAYQQQVAIKLLRSDLDHDELIRRFRRERQILAHLDHPNIAKLLDGGTTPDGRPYLVMEYVEGLPIDTYCQHCALDIPARLRLFSKVCAAVHLAHQSLVVHRDLMPANVLVTVEGEPKLLDFGIAKLLAAEQFPMTVAETVPGLKLMTPEYASPEQVRGLEVTTASDVYSLGIVLYELLAETRPFEVRDMPAGEAMWRLLESRPTRPSAAVARATGGGGEQAGGDRATAVADTLTFIFSTASPGQARGETITAREVLDAGLGEIDRLDDRPLLQADLQLTMGRVYRSLGLLPTAIDLLEKSLATRRRIHGVRHREIAESLERLLYAEPHQRLALTLDLLGRVLVRLDRVEEAEAMFVEALTLRRAVYGPGHARVADTLANLAQVELERGALDPAETFYRESLTIQRAVLPAEHPDLLASISNLAGVLVKQGQPTPAEALYEEALAGNRRQFGDRHRTVPLVLNNLAGSAFALGDFSRAVRLREEAVSILLEPSTPWSARSNVALLALAVRPDRTQGRIVNARIRAEGYRQARSTFSSASLLDVVGE